ncbi:alanine dehydrogenase [Kocuria palustris]|uniref:alanine dehydrogenase n=1 Tax=Kocuria palustris TaxID=71999 RepID=UPI0011A16877|nr:alanine dehydrogenase [Kocuria palustris]
MIIGVPAETKAQEDRVALTPAGVHQLVGHGHEVRVQEGAGLGSRIPDEEYAAAGASIVPVDQAWAAELVLKVKEPIPQEYGFLREDLTLFTYLHLAASRELTQALLESGTTSLAYESVQTERRTLPLLAPMSEVAGRMAATVGANALLSSHGGRGILMAGVPGVRPARATVIGAGQAGGSAVHQLVGMGADVTVLDTSIDALRRMDDLYGSRVRTIMSTPYEVENCVVDSDLVVGAVLIPGRKAPNVVTHEMVLKMKKGAVLVDIAVDQGGCFEDTRPTTHQDPTFEVGPAVFYCVANMPGAVPATSTAALTNATLPYVLRVADDGWKKACADSRELEHGLSTSHGKLRNADVIAEFPDLPAA